MSGRWTLIGDGVVGRPGKFSSGAPLGSGDGPHDWVVIHLDMGRRQSTRTIVGLDSWTASTSNKRKTSFSSDLGPELPDQLVPQDLAERLRGREMPIKSALLDQRIIAGLGNIYVCEILHRAGVSPRRKASSVAGLSGISEESRELQRQHTMLSRRQ